MFNKKLTILLLLASVLTLSLIVVGCGTGNDLSQGSTSSSENSKQSMQILATTVDWIDFPLDGQEHAEIIVYGKVTKIDPGQWNSPDGKWWEPDDPSGMSMGIIYRTYYVEPTEVLKGTPKWGTPVAFIVEGGTEGETIGPVWVGDTVLVLGADYADTGVYGKVYWKENAYFSMAGDTTVFVLRDGTLNKAVHLSNDGKVQETVRADRGGTVELDTMRQAIAATKAGESIRWYGEDPTTTTQPGSSE